VPLGAGQVGEITQNIEEGRHDGLLRMDGDHRRNERSFCVLCRILITGRIALRLEPHGLIAQVSVSLDLPHEVPFDNLWRLPAHQPDERSEDKLTVGQWLSASKIQTGRLDVNQAVRWVRTSCGVQT